MHFDMQDVFQIIPQHMVLILSDKLDMLFTYQMTKEKVVVSLHDNSSDAVLILQLSTVQQATPNATTSLESIDIVNVDIIKYFQDLDDTAIYMSNKYYAMYRS